MQAVKALILSQDLLWIIVEQATYANPLPCCPRMAGKTVSVIPRTHDEYHRMIDNPFRGPSRKRVIRLNAANNIVELISDYPIGSYMLRYVKQPNPIILVNLSGDVSIRGEQSESTGSLPDFLHEEILSRAVVLAIQSRSFLAGKQGERQTTTT